MDIITLIEGFVEGLLQAGEKFTQHPEQFARLEQTVSELSSRAAADFLAMTLTQTDELIRCNGRRKREYNIQRRDSRTLITTVGDVTFQHTLFQNKETKKCRYLLDEMIRLPIHERFSSQAEAKVLSEAEVHSYQHAADSLCIGAQKISKTAVMEKVHGITEELPEQEALADEDKKWCEYLYIEADEDHIHRQKCGEKEGSMLGKLVYLFEGKEEVCKGKRILIHPHYHGGLYAGSEANRQLWEEIEKYIEEHYDTEYLKKVYINSDGGGWIRSGKDYVDRSELVADRFHLMKYINRVSNLMGEKRDSIKGRIYRYIYKDKLTAVKKLLTRIRNQAGHEEMVEETRTYFINNWEAIQTAFHDKHALGCSAEGHVSCVYSERMSSRPMGWSETGGDRMCRLRCYVRNYGRDKIIELVEYRREKQMGRFAATGTEGLVEFEEKRRYVTEERRRAMKYIERLQARIPGDTVRKVISIRERLNEL